MEDRFGYLVKSELESYFRREMLDSVVKNQENLESVRKRLRLSIGCNPDDNNPELVSPPK